MFGFFPVTEEAGVARLPLIRSGGNFGRVSVMYKTFGITATEGVDYLKPSGEVVFEDGVRNTTLDVTIQDDSELEYEETFRVQLTTPTGRGLSLITEVSSYTRKPVFGGFRPGLTQTGLYNLRRKLEVTAQLICVFVLAWSKSGFLMTRLKLWI